MPDDAAVSFHQATEFLSARNIESALLMFSQAETLGYSTAECAAARWMCWMFLGDFERAWQESDYISERVPRSADQLWNGESWAGKHVMLRCLHGLGDTVQFIRYAPLLKQTCRRLTVQTHPELVTLLRHVPAVDAVITWGPGTVEPQDWEMQMEVTELPRAFRTTLGGIPKNCPYLSLPNACSENRSTGAVKVGIVWEAGPFDPMRTLVFSELEPLLSHKRCEFYALQKTVEATMLERYRNLRNVTSHRRDVLATATVMMGLDLVITVDTMSAHLAGALGRPVWIILPERADWRWMLGSLDTPWYPTAKLFRQERTGEWRPTIERVASELSIFQPAAFPPVSASSKRDAMDTEITQLNARFRNCRISPS